MVMMTVMMMPCMTMIGVIVTMVWRVRMAQFEAPG